MKIKVIFISLICVILMSLSVKAESSTEQAKSFFERYIHLCYTYDKSVVDQYANNAVIKRIVISPDNSKKLRYIPIGEYRKKLKFYAPFARIRGYKNLYSGLRYIPENENVRIEGYRQVIYENYKTPISILVGKDEKGKWVIKEETLYTKAIKLL